MGVKFIWNKDYSVGDEELDNHHRNLFKLGNKIQESDRSAARKFIMELYRYIRLHFDHEEKHMQRMEFPGIDRHKTLHDDFITRLNELSEGFTDNNFDELTVFLHVWLIKHVLLEDKKYSAYIRSEKKSS